MHYCDTPKESDEKADELLQAYALGVVPLSGWATPDLIALSQAIDDELIERDALEEPADE